MSDQHRDLHDDAHAEWREERADEFAAIQRRAFKAGFEAAAAESENFRHLRAWLEEEREHARERMDEDIGDQARYYTLVNVLVKLAEIGCEPVDDDDD